MLSERRWSGAAGWTEDWGAEIEALSRALREEGVDAAPPVPQGQLGATAPAARRCRPVFCAVCDEWIYEGEETYCEECGNPVHDFEDCTIDDPERGILCAYCYEDRE